jgi:hypothetical protein
MPENQYVRIYSNSSELLPGDTMSILKYKSTVPISGTPYVDVWIGKANTSYTLKITVVDKPDLLFKEIIIQSISKQGRWQLPVIWDVTDRETAMSFMSNQA